MTAPFALYVHVPWCRHVCPYCDFNVHAAQHPPEADDLAAWTREFSTWTAEPAWAGRSVGSVYFGGGTPSLVSPATIGKFLAVVSRVAALDAGAEISLEANPGTVDRSRLADYRDVGVTRLSLGVQSFDPQHLRTLGRDHGPDEARAAARDARRAGFDDVSLDLIYGVPGQTLDAWEADLRAAIELAPDHVSAYALTWEERTPFARWRASGRLAAIDEDAEAAMAVATDAVLTEAGYGRYEISSWARPGHHARHNTSYWDGSDYLGLGPGAHGFCATPHPGRRWSTERDPAAHRARVAADGLAIAESHDLDEAEARGDFVFTGLRRLVGVDEAEFARRFGITIAEAYPRILPALVRDGLVDRTGGRLRLSATGLRFADTVAAAFV